jgi:hypothetical protein
MWTIGGNTWLAAAAVNITQIQYTGDGTPSNADVRIQAVSGGPVVPGTGALGLLDGLSIKIELFDVENPSDGTYDMIPNATIGSVSGGHHRRYRSRGAGSIGPDARADV